MVWSTSSSTSRASIPSSPSSSTGRTRCRETHFLSIRLSLFLLAFLFVPLLPAAYDHHSAAHQSHRNLLTSGYTTSHRGDVPLPEKSTRNDPKTELFSSAPTARPPIIPLFQHPRFHPLRAARFFPRFPFISRRCLSLVTEDVATSSSGISRRATNDVTSTRDTRRYRT